jgi:hypothetical protein
MGQLFFGIALGVAFSYGAPWLWKKIEERIKAKLEQAAK